MGYSVLIVDDEREASESLKMFFELKGFTVRLASSGREGVAAVRESTPDIVLLDLQMPGMDGWQTLQEMREAVPTLRVAIVTGSVPDRGLEEMALKGGAVGIVTKPIKVDELVPKIRAFIEGTA